MIKKALAIIAILVMAFSSTALVMAQEEGAPPSEPAPPPSEPVPPEAPPSEPMPVPSEPIAEPVPPSEPIEQPPQPIENPPQEQGLCYWEGRQIPCEEMPSTRQPGVDEQPQQPGPERGGCWVGETQVPCPGEGPKVPEGCREIIEPNGMRRVDCAGQQRQPEQIRCTPGDVRERIEKECAAKGGTIATRDIDPSRGCGIVDCVFGQEGAGFAPVEGRGCPSPEMLLKKEESCRSMGLNPARKRSKCEYVECEDPNKQHFECPDSREEWERYSKECSQKGGRVVKGFDNAGCNVPKCVAGGEECPNDVPQEAYWKCEGQGGRLIVNTDESGCITFSKCVKRGEAVREEDYNELEEVPPAAKLLQVALKLESIKISFDQMAKQIQAIADYYEKEDDMANADKFRRAAGMFESAKKQIDSVKEELKLAARGMSLEQMRDIKYKIRQISDVVMEDALFIILGGEAEGDYDYRPAEKEDYREGFVPEMEADCGSDGMCFEKAVRVCEPGVSFRPDRYAELKIVGVEGADCLIKAKADTPIGEMGMECSFPDYATNSLKPETLIPYCKGEMAEYAKTQYLGRNKIEPAGEIDREKVYEGQMMGCEKVERGINKRGVCGNECCEERYGESYYSCSSDCIAPQMARQVERQPFAEKARQVFRQENGEGCRDEIDGTSPKDVCGNECCEPGESRSNCPQDCTGEPMYDEGKFFNEQRGPMVAPQRQFEQPPDYIAPGEQMPVQGIEETPPQEPIIEQASEPAVEGGGEGIVAGAAVAIDLLKEFLGR